MKKTFKKLYIPISVIFFIAAIGVFVFVYTGIGKRQHEAEEIFTTWQTEEGKIEEMQLLDKALEALVEERMDLDAHFAKSTNVVPFLNTLEALAAQAKTASEVTDVDMLPDKTGLTVSIHTDGTFESTYKFLQLLENSPYELEFLSMNISRGEVADNAKVPTWSGNFKIKLLSFVP